MTTSRISELSAEGGADSGAEAGAPARPPSGSPPTQAARPAPAARPEVTESTRLFVPAHPRVPADPEQRPGIGIELQTDAATGELVVAVFTTLDALVEALGEDQPWIVLPAGLLAEFVRQHDVERISVDPIVHPNTVHTWTPERLQALETAVVS